MKERVAWWDNIRFVLITLVVVAHFADVFIAESNLYKSIFLFIYSFHMPLFILISGRLHSNNRLTEKCFFYISLAFLLKVVLSISYQAIGGKPYFSLLSDDSLPWYLFAMAAYMIITYILRNQNKWLVLVLAVVIACFTGLDTNIGDTLYLSRIVVFFPFYWMGTMINTEDLLRIKAKKWAILIAALFVVAWGTCCLIGLDDLYALRQFFTGRNHYPATVFEYGPFIRLCCYGISAIMSLAVMLLIPTRRLAKISEMGERSIHVYFWHWPVFRILTLVGIKELFYIGNDIGKILYLLSAVIVTILLSQKFATYPIECVRKLCFKDK